MIKKNCKKCKYRMKNFFLESINCEKVKKVLVQIYVIFLNIEYILLCNFIWFWEIIVMCIGMVGY